MDEAHRDRLGALGWDDDWQQAYDERVQDRDEPAAPGRVVRVDLGRLLIASADGVVSAHSPRGGPGAVGDWTVVGLPAEIHRAEILPRRTLLERHAVGANEAQPIAANVDLVLIVCGLDRPLRPGRLMRGITQSWEAGATPLIVLTKSDLADPGEAEAAIAEEVVGVDVIIVSSLAGEGVADLAEVLADSTAVAIGESGSGKSTLVHALTGEDVEVGTVRAADAKGRHTTTRRELHVLPTGGCLIDTPGLRELGLWADTDSVASAFADIEAIATECRFRDCSHGGEPGCAVAAAVQSGALSPGRLVQFRKLLRETERLDRAQIPREQRMHERRLTRMYRATPNKPRKD